MNWIAKLERTKKDLEKTINLEKRKLMMEKEMLSFKVSNLEKKIEEIAEMEKELEISRKEKEGMKQLEEEKLSKERFLKDLDSRIQKLKQVNENIEKRGDEIITKISLLENPEPNCPVCGKEMRYDHKVNVKMKMNEQVSRERNLFKKNLEQLKEFEGKKELGESELKDIERKLLARPLIQDKEALLKEKIAETRQEARELSNLEKRAEDVKRTIIDRSYAPMAQKLLKEVNKEIRKNL